MSLSDPKFAQNFKTETWALYGVGILAIVFRGIARVKRLGFSGLQLDDYLMLTVTVWFTLLCVAINQVIAGGGSNLLTAEEVLALTPETKVARISGSKWVYVSEHMMVLTIWTLKFCMLAIYGRITNGLSQRKLVNYCAIYTGVSFVGTELALFLICRPITDHWAVPTPNYQCSSYQYYEIINGCLSITGDIFMLLVGIPLLMSVRLPLKQKCILLFIFGLGIFVIVAALLTKVYCLVPSLISYVYMNWYFREATVAVLVTNLPLTWSLLRDIFPSLRNWSSGGSGPTGRLGAILSSPGRSSRAALQSIDYKLQSFTRLGSTTDTGKSAFKGKRQHSPTTIGSDDDGSVRSLHIRQDVTITVQSEDAKDGNDVEGGGHQKTIDDNSSSQTVTPPPERMYQGTAGVSIKINGAHPRKSPANERGRPDLNS
ncbi:hypothetical protein ACJ72_01742 [Emergomyces africanus]|uniref:Rhodopsin domain-containing protein n=1 Tax=Emergomyces africanus TaxID=1955775 RepID=A0A1B7P4D4_9EURO|nr:hypothetical protein ACJ72_01742 [Emergomyces africanus]